MRIRRLVLDVDKAFAQPSLFDIAAAIEKVSGVEGTITSWWNPTEERRDPSVHWLAVRPDSQRLGLAAALVSECLQRLVWLEGQRDIFLHTQTWSHRAIAIYLKAGFEFARQGSFGGYPNDYLQAMPVLKTVLPSLVH